MGAWSCEPFGNDTASDWAYALEDTKDLSHVEAALNPSGFNSPWPATKGI